MVYNIVTSKLVPRFWLPMHFRVHFRVSSSVLMPSGPVGPTSASPSEEQWRRSPPGGAEPERDPLPAMSNMDQNPLRVALAPPATRNWGFMTCTGLCHTGRQGRAQGEHAGDARPRPKGRCPVPTD